MSESEVTPVPVVGNLSATVIRACRVHEDCDLGCPERERLEMGVIATLQTTWPEPATTITQSGGA